MRMPKCKPSWIYWTLVIVICVEMTSLGYSVLSWQYWVAVGCVIGAFICGEFDGMNGGK